MLEGLLKKNLGSITRHLLQILGTALVTNNLLSPEQSAGLVTALDPLVLNLVSLLWTLYANYRDQRTLTEAAAAEPFGPGHIVP